MSSSLHLFNQIDSPSIYGLVERAELDWGQPEENAKNLISYYLAPEFDTTVCGLDVTRGEYIVLQGDEKNRKTTFLLNLVYVFARQLKKHNKWVCVDTLESGMVPGAYRDALLNMVATRYMVSRVFGGDRYKWPSPDQIMGHEDLKTQLVLDQNFLMYNKKSEFQLEAIEYAKKVVGSLPISIFGAAKKEGMARRLDTNMERWQMLYEGTFPKLEGCEHFLFITDNVQQVSDFDSNSAYGSLGGIVSTHGNFAAENRVVVWDVHQISLRSKEAKDPMARGGKRANEEANYVFETTYESDLNPLWLKLRTPRSRKKPPPKLRIPIEPNSGAILGKAIVDEL